MKSVKSRFLTMSFLFPFPKVNPYELDDREKDKTDDASIKTSEGSIITGTGSSLPATTGCGSTLDETREDHADDEGEKLWLMSFSLDKLRKHP